MRISIYVVVFALSLGSVLLYGDIRYHAGRADLLAEQAKKAGADRKEADQHTAAADAGAAQAKSEGGQVQAASIEHTKTVVQTVTRIVHETPAAAECRVPPDSLRELSAAIDRANAAAGRVPGAQPVREASADVRQP